jgi:hypothetical protein
MARRFDMKYAALIYAEPGAHEEGGQEEFETMFREYMALAADPHCVGNGQLHPVESATTVRVQDGRTLTTDGPFAETKEVLGGYYIFEADNLDQVIELAARIPAARIGGSVEIRPLVER